MDTLCQDPLWALWHPCCANNPWYTQWAAVGVPFNRIGLLSSPCGLATDGVLYFAAPDFNDLQDFTCMICAGLHEGLTRHNLAAFLPSRPPSWKPIVPATRVAPKWELAKWIQHLHPDIRVTDNMTFCYQNVYVTLNPWDVETALHAPEAGMDIHSWVDRHLHLYDIGYTSMADAPMGSPLDQLQIVRVPDMSLLNAWLRRHLDPDTSTWHQRGLHRVTRYLISHNYEDASLNDADMDVLLFLTANRSHLMIWQGDMVHSLYQWLRNHVLTPHMWHDQQQVTHSGWPLQYQPPAPSYIISSPHPYQSNRYTPFPRNIGTDQESVLAALRSCGCPHNPSAPWTGHQSSLDAGM